MIYRIMKAPPGYSAEQQYMVSAYETIDLDSFRFNVTKNDGSKFVATLDEARRMLPNNATALPFEPEYQFLELWEV